MIEENKEIIVKEEVTSTNKEETPKRMRTAKILKPEEKQPEIIDLKAQRAAMIEKRMLRDKEKVRGIFKFHEIQGAALSFTFREYKGEPARKYTFVDGETYETTRGIARHLNTSGWWPVHEHKIDKDGKPSVDIGKKVRRYGFYPLDFVDVGQYENQDSKIILANQNY